MYAERLVLLILNMQRTLIASFHTNVDSSSRGVRLYRDLFSEQTPEYTQKHTQHHTLTSQKPSVAPFQPVPDHHALPHCGGELSHIQRQIYFVHMQVFFLHKVEKVCDAERTGSEFSCTFNLQS